MTSLIFSELLKKPIRKEVVCCFLGFWEHIRKKRLLFHRIGQEILGQQQKPVVVYVKAGSL